MTTEQSQHEYHASEIEYRQWRMSLRTSLALAAAGVFLITYVVLDAVSNTRPLDTTAMLIGAAIVVEVMAGVFLWNASRARASLLRLLVRGRTDGNMGVAIAGSIDDDALRAKTLAQLALHFSGVPEGSSETSAELDPATARPHGSV